MPRPKIELKSFDDMFALHGEDERARGEARAANASDESRNSGLTSVHGNRESLQIPLVQLHPFAHHPFKRYSGAKMAEMVKSVKEHGIITPILVRRREEGGWEIISGHNRVEAARLAGLKTIPAYPRDADDNAAAIMMVDSNFHQREKILPSERAFAYKLKLEAIKRQGERTDLTSMEFSARIMRILARVFSKRKTIHGVLVEVYGLGILMRGDSGVGKSETALELIHRGHRLVADDTVEINCINGNTLMGAGRNKIIGHHPCDFPLLRH